MRTPWEIPGLADLIDDLPRQIPSLGGMRVRLQHCDRQGLALCAPLAFNHNDKGTAFAGSIGTLAVVTGWAVAVLCARSLGSEADVAATRCQVDFEQPLSADLCALCSWPDSAALGRLGRGLARHGLARLALDVRVGAARDLGAGAAKAALRYAVRVRATDGRTGD